MSISAIAVCLFGFAPGGAGSALPATPPPTLISTVSTGQPFVMEKSLYPERPTVFLFYAEKNEVDRKVLDDLLSHANERKGRFGVRIVQLTSLSDPAAVMYEIRATPTMMALDRFGALLKRSSDLGEIGTAVTKASRMARIKWVDEADATAEAAYRSMGKGKQSVAGIMKTMSLRPELMEGISRIAQMAHFSNGFLPRRTKEMIATYVSAINHCKF